MITLPFRRKKESKERKPIKGEKAKEEKKPKKEKSMLPKKQGMLKKETGRSDIAYKTLHSPLISEKITMLEEEGKYVFKVFKGANKNMIKRAIEDLYKTKVDKINILNVKRKKKRLGRSQGWKKGYKKAVVTLKKGEKIEVVTR